MRRGILLAGGAVLVVVLVIGGAYWLGTTSSHDTAGSGTPPPSTSPTAPNTSRPGKTAAAPATARVSHSPVDTAKQWVSARNTVTWHDRPATKWVDRATPVVTGQLASEQQAASRGGRGADWHTFVAHHCQRRATQLDAVIPPEAPRSKRTVYVQTDATSTTSCSNGTRPASETGRTHDSATLQADRQPDGTWRLSKRIH